MGTKAETRIGGDRFRFGETLWTLVLKARDRGAPECQAALDQLIRAYWKPVYFYIRKKARNIEDAKDLTQGFFATILERDCLKDVDRQKGQFKTFLLLLLERYLINEAERRQARKRGGGRLRLDLESAEREFAQKLDDSATAERAFERGWARSVLARAFERTEQELVRNGLRPQAAALSLYLRENVAPRDIASRLNQPGKTIENWLARGRKRFREAVLDEIRGYVVSAEEAEAELSEILRHIS